PHLALAEVSLQSKAFDQAIQESQTVLKLQPEQGQARLIMGRAYLGKGDINNARSALTAVTAKVPQQPEGYYYLGLAYRRQRHELEAHAAFEKALALNPHLIDALSQVAAMYLAKGEGQKAIERVRTQAQVPPNNPFVYDLLGSLYLTLNKDDMAEAAFKK